MDISLVSKEIKLSVCLKCGCIVRGDTCGPMCVNEGVSPLSRPPGTVGSATYVLKDVVEFGIDDRNNTGHEGAVGPQGWQGETPNERLRRELSDPQLLARAHEEAKVMFEKAKAEADRIGEMLRKQTGDDNFMSAEYVK